MPCSACISSTNLAIEVVMTMPSLPIYLPRLSCPFFAGPCRRS